MYQYEDDIPLSVEELLKRVSQESIFELIFKEPIIYGKKYKSIFRTDNNPNCRFQIREDNTVLFIDFGDITRHRSCIGSIMEYKKLSMQSAINYIAEKLNITHQSPIIFEVKPQQNLSHQKKDIISKDIITYDKISYDKRHILDWSRFLIKKEELLSDNVFATNRIYIQKSSKKRKVINLYYPSYAIDFISSVKIYQPYSKDYKFITNCSENDIGNIDNLPATGDRLIIQKSYKDYRVLRNMELENIVWLHNEGCIPDEDILFNLMSRFKKIVIFFDNDLTGIKAARKLRNQLYRISPIADIDIVWLPRRLKDLENHNRFLKDPSDFIHKEGRADLREILKLIGLIS